MIAKGFHYDEKYFNLATKVLKALYKKTNNERFAESFFKPFAEKFQTISFLTDFHPLIKDFDSGKIE